MRTLDKQRSLKLIHADGDWYVDCGKTSTRTSVHRLVGYNQNTNSFDFDKKLKLTGSHQFLWFVSHKNGSYELYTVSFHPSKFSQCIIVFLGKDVSNQYPDFSQVSIDMYNKKIGW